MTTDSLGAGTDLNTTSLCWATAAGGRGKEGLTLLMVDLVLPDCPSAGQYISTL